MQVRSHFHLGRLGLSQLEHHLSALSALSLACVWHDRVAELPCQVPTRCSSWCGLRSAQDQRVPDQVLDSDPFCPSCVCLGSSSGMKGGCAESVSCFGHLYVISPSTAKMIRSLSCFPGFAKVGRCLHAFIHVASSWRSVLSVIVLSHLRASVCPWSGGLDPAPRVEEPYVRASSFLLWMFFYHVAAVPPCGQYFFQNVTAFW